MGATAEDVRVALRDAGNPKDAVLLQGYFKTDPGQYGEGDVFYGVRAAGTRAIVKRFRELPLDEIDRLLDDPVHECRLAAVLLLVEQYRHSPDTVFDRYLAAVRRGRVDNWDIVDSSAPEIVGAQLLERDRSLLFELAASPSLWDRRIAIVATHRFIRNGDATTTLALAELLVRDREDLMHKAVGWMLREVGKRVDRSALLGFLDEHAAEMPRTMLSYAIEHLSPEERAHYRAQRS